MKRVSEDVFKGLTISGNAVFASIEEQTKETRHTLFLSYGRTKLEVVDLWTYLDTASSKYLSSKGKDTLFKSLFKDCPPIIGYFKDRRVMFIHPKEERGNVLIIWCVEDDTIDWIQYRNDGIAEILTSEYYADKFGLLSVQEYEQMKKGR